MQTITVVSLEGSGKSEVGNFYVEVCGEEDVLRLQISVSDAFIVNVVYTFDHLTEVIPSQPLSIFSSLI